MDYILFAVIAYFLLAFVNLGDKLIVDRVLKNSRVYVFFVCFLGLLTFLLAPWFLSWPGLTLFLFNIFIGFLFAAAIWLFFEALKESEVLRVSVFVGSIIPIFSVIISIFFLKEEFAFRQLFGFLFLIFGMFLISTIVEPQKNNSSKKWIILGILSALFYSLFFVTSKIAYSEQPFFSAFIWTRLGAFVFVLFFLLNKEFRIDIFSKNSNSGVVGKNKKKGFFIVFNQGVGSVAFIIQNYAISLGSVAVVNALQGIQYVFLFIISFVASLFVPGLIRDDFSFISVFKKILSIILVFVGLYLLAF